MLVGNNTELSLYVRWLDISCLSVSSFLVNLFPRKYPPIVKNNEKNNSDTTLIIANAKFKFIYNLYLLFVLSDRQD